jgi:hypothetical protein
VPVVIYVIKVAAKLNLSRFRARSWSHDFRRRTRGNIFLGGELERSGVMGHDTFHCLLQHLIERPQSRQQQRLKKRGVGVCTAQQLSIIPRRGGGGGCGYSELAAAAAAASSPASHQSIGQENFFYLFKSRSYILIYEYTVVLMQGFVSEKM